LKNANPTKNLGRTHVLWKGKQFLLHLWYLFAQLCGTWSYCLVNIILNNIPKQKQSEIQNKKEISHEYVGLSCSFWIDFNLSTYFRKSTKFIFYEMIISTNISCFHSVPHNCANRYHKWSRNCLPFQSTWVLPRFVI
jgi:hypothetical protein